MNLKEHIIENGYIAIDSIFRFEDNPGELLDFLKECGEKNCKVEFRQESLEYIPGGYLSKTGYGSSSDFLAMAFVTYMQMHKAYFLKHMDYKMNMEKNDDFVTKLG